MSHRITSRIEFDCYVRALCLIFDCSETSGYRTKHRNGLPSIDGAPRSRHMDGLARDLVPDLMTSVRMAQIKDASEKLGLYALVENDHVHIQVQRTDIPE